MPNYDFRCNTCRHKFSCCVSIKDKDKVCCPECGGPVSQLFTGFLYSRKSEGGIGAGSSCTKTSCNSCSGCN